MKKLVLAVLLVSASAWADSVDCRDNGKTFFTISNLRNRCVSMFSVTTKDAAGKSYTSETAAMGFSSGSNFLFGCEFGITKGPKKGTVKLKKVSEEKGSAVFTSFSGDETDLECTFGPESTKLEAEAPEKDTPAR